IILIFFILTRISPYINNPVPLGYDAGLYVFSMKYFPNLPAWLMNGYWSLLFFFTWPFVHIVGITAESIVIPLAILSQIVLFFSLYFVIKKIYCGKTALWAVLLLATSVIQFRTFWFFYIKNSLAIALLLPTLYFLHKRKLIPTIIFGSLVGMMHLPTFMILIIIMTIEILLNIYHVIQKNFSNYNNLFLNLISLICILIITCLFYLPYLKQIILPFFIPIISSTIIGEVVTGNAPGSGTFYPVLTSFLLTMLYLPFSLYGFYVAIRGKNNYKPFTTAFAVCLIMVIAKFFFYQRLFIILDIFLIIFASIGITGLSGHYKKSESILDLIRFYPLLLILFVAGFIFKTGQPLISKEIFAEIKQFGKTHEQVYILSTAKEDSAWLMGYTDNPVIAWGYGGYDKYWEYSEWLNFFSDSTEKEKITLLKKLPHPLYIFINDKTSTRLKNLIKSQCLKNESGHFYKVNCFSSKLAIIDI
ncbi:glycosyltransferase family 39 protein, partial [Patescibacteria group bacterium]|nr:glycosyltransferase family 39 protein [Patescibacteria group bacterium]